MEPWQSALAFWIPLIFMLVGLFGLIIPIFPGLVVIWLSALFFGLVVGFDTLGIIIFILITLGMVAGSLVDNFLMGAGARVGGASWLTIKPVPMPRQQCDFPGNNTELGTTWPAL
jgi:uncharacterized protein YqgC (DUF456 family)